MDIIINLIKNPIFWILFILIAISKAIDAIPQKEIYPYKKTNVLTKNEAVFYTALRQIASKYNLVIFAKVRIADIVKTDGVKGKQRTIAFNRIAQKHIDFLIMNTNVETVCCIELDDKSHDNEKAQKKDNFKNNALKSAGIKLIRTRDIKGVEEQISQAIQQIKKG